MDKRNEVREEIGKVSVLSIKVEKKSSILIDISLSGLQLIIPFAPEKNEVKIELEIKKKIYNFKGYIHWASRSLIKLNWYQVGISIIDPEQDLIDEIEKTLSIY